MKDHTWLDYVTAFGSVATPILVLILTAIGWRLRSRLERRAVLEDKLREDRINTYNRILESFIIQLTSYVAWKKDPKNKDIDKNDIVEQNMLSLEYREHVLCMYLVGSDSVVTSYNNLMKADLDHKNVKTLFGQFLLEIRKSMGNEATKLNGLDMVKVFLREGRNY